MNFENEMENAYLEGYYAALEEAGYDLEDEVEEDDEMENAFLEGYYDAIEAINEGKVIDISNRNQTSKKKSNKNLISRKIDPDKNGYSHEVYINKYGGRTDVGYKLGDNGQWSKKVTRSVPGNKASKALHIIKHKLHPNKVYDF